MNPKQYEKYVRAYNRRVEEDIRKADFMNHALGRYIAFAFHDPDHYPDEPFSAGSKEKPQMTDKDMERMAMMNTVALGGKVDGINT